jgi:hypothetical protein
MKESKLRPNWQLQPATQANQTPVGHGVLLLISLFRISLCLGDSLGVGDLLAKGKECQ